MPCFSKTIPSGRRYSTKRIGPRIDPWGTPHLKGGRVPHFNK